MKEYPKTETLYDRDKKTFKVNGQLRMQEFALVKTWYVTEKIHGTNIRVQWDGQIVQFAARDSEKLEHIPGDLLKYLQETFTPEKLAEAFPSADAFDNTVTLYGEGCGPGIQKGGADYSKTKTFVLFDVLVGKYWLEPVNIADVAGKLGIRMVPLLGEAMELQEIHNMCQAGFYSPLAMSNGVENRIAEGVIAITVPGLMTRYGTRLKFKLKNEDFPRTK